jgi:hypothetical protein
MTKHYRFTDEELDIRLSAGINDDIKYCLGYDSGDFEGA